jgi:hypothetical protein
MHYKKLANSDRKDYEDKVEHIWVVESHGGHKTRNPNLNYLKPKYSGVISGVNCQNPNYFSGNSGNSLGYPICPINPTYSKTHYS